MSWFSELTKSASNFLGQAREKVKDFFSSNEEESSSQIEDDSSDYLESDRQQESDDDRNYTALIGELPGDLLERDESPAPIDLILDESPKDFISELLGDTPQIDDENNDEYSPDLLSEFEDDFVITNEIQQLESLFNDNEPDEDFSRLYDEYKLAESLGVSHAELISQLSPDDIDLLLDELSPPESSTVEVSDLSDTTTMPNDDMEILREQMIQELAESLFLNDHEVQDLRDLDDETLIYISTLRISENEDDTKNPNFRVIKTENFRDLSKAVKKLLSRQKFGYQPSNGFFVIDQFNYSFEFYYQI